MYIYIYIYIPTYIHTYTHMYSYAHRTIHALTPRRAFSMRAFSVFSMCAQIFMRSQSFLV